MGNCLKTQLKEVVNNSNLKKLGVLVYNANTTSSSSVCRVIVVLNKSTEAKSYGEQFVTPYNQDSPIGYVVPINANESSILELKQGVETKVEIADKYALISLNKNYGTTLDLNELEYCNSLTTLTVQGTVSGTLDGSKHTAIKDIAFSYSSVSMNINTFSANTSLESLTCDNCGNVSGNIESLSGLPNLKTLYITGTKLVTGDANIFADNTKFTALTNLNLTLCSNITNKTAEVKAAIEAAHPGITVTW